MNCVMPLSKFPKRFPLARRLVPILLALTGLLVLPSAKADSWASYQGAQDEQGRVAAMSQWAVRLAEQGTTVPTDLALALDAMKLGATTDSLEAYALELRRQEGEPLPFGEVTYRLLSGQAQVGALVDIEVTYRTADGLPEGATVMLARHWQSPTPLQSGQGGNVSLVRAPLVDSITWIYERFTGINGSPFGLAELPTLVLSEGLSAGQSLVLRYSDIELPTQPGAYPLPVYIRYPDADHWYTARYPTLPISAGPFANLTIDGPLTVQVNEPFSIALSARDRYGNLVPANATSLDLLVNGLFKQRVPVSGTVTTVDNLIMDDDGVYDIEVRSGGGGIRANLTPVIAKDVLKFAVTFADLRQEAGNTLHFGERSNLPGAEITYSAGMRDIDNQSQVMTANIINAPMVAGGRAMFLLSPPATVALPEMTTDHRRYSPQFVEVFTGGSQHEWLLNHFASLGYRVGVTTSADSLVKRATRNTPLTAVIGQPGQSPTDALAARRTYAVSDERMFLDMKVNEGRPGDRIAVAEERRVTASLIAASPIVSIEVVKNGEVVYQPPQEFEPGALNVSTYSDSAPLAPGLDVPRNAREWIGFVRFENAEVANVDQAAMHQKPGTAAIANPRYRDRVDFFTWTHGNTSSFRLDYVPTDVDEDVRLEVALRGGYEDVDFLSEYRAPAETPAIRQSFNLVELNNGVEREFRVDGYVDRLRIEPVVVGRTSRDVSYTDRSPPQPGDYYYLRATTAAGGKLISSPVYVGGTDHD